MKCWHGCKNINICEKDFIWNPATCNCENGKYLASIMDKIICDEIIDVKEKNFNEKNITFKTQSFYILLPYLPFTITLLRAVTINCYLIKHRVKQKQKLSLGRFLLFIELRPKSVRFHFRRYKKSFFLRKCNLIIRARKFHFLKYKEFFSGWIFSAFFFSFSFSFFFFSGEGGGGLGLGSAPGGPKNYY